MTAHLLVPAPPWRDPAWPGVTGCARLADTVGQALPRAEFAARNRAGEMVCGTCYWKAWMVPAVLDWHADPVAVIALDAAARVDRTGRRYRLAAELRALAALVTRHPGEFASLREAEQVLTALGGR